LYTLCKIFQDALSHPDIFIIRGKNGKRKPSIYENLRPYLQMARVNCAMQKTARVNLK
jgi:hypothetical protein